MVLFIHYPKCSTCQKAKKWLEDNQVDFKARYIVEENPQAEELAEWIARSGLPIKKFFNTSGLRYKELNLKERLPQMSEAEQIALLTTDGMLIKRPLVIADDAVLTGFKEEAWRKALLKA